MNTKSQLFVRAGFILATALLPLVANLAAAESDDTTDEGPLGIERKLHGAWQGPACGGDWTFSKNGTFTAEHYSPGNNQLTGTWKLRWKALPPILALTIQTSDAPERIEIGETWEIKVTELNDEALAYEWPQDPGHTVHWSRVKKTVP